MKAGDILVSKSSAMPTSSRHERGVVLARKRAWRDMFAVRVAWLGCDEVSVYMLEDELEKFYRVLKV